VGYRESFIAIFRIKRLPIKSQPCRYFDSHPMIAGADKDKAGANLMVIHLATDECKARIIAGNIDPGQTAKMFRINQGNGLRQTALGQ
jgi:hypothetical protein